MNRDVKVLVVEGDELMALEIEMMITKMGLVSLGNFRSSKEAIRAIQEKKPDLIIMDFAIEGELDEIEIAKEISQQKIPLIFITAFKDNESFVRANQIEHIAYLVKPFHCLTLKSVIEKAIVGSQQSNLLEDDSKFIFVKIKNVLCKVSIADIQWIEVVGNYSYIFAEGKKHILKLSLKKILTKINNQGDFLKIHRQYVIQSKFATHLDVTNNTIKVGDHFIPIGRKYKQEVVVRFKTL